MNLKVRYLGVCEYAGIWQRMQEFTDTRDEETDDEIWLLQHPPVFTLGKSARKEHLLATGDIPVVQIDRGGQVTYHGPGQLVVYVLLDIHRLGIGVRELVTRLENSVIYMLKKYDIDSNSRTKAPGVYVDGKKIAALGLRVRKGRCFHGLAINVEMDLSPFDRIDPCGYPGLKVTQLSELVEQVNFDDVCQKLVSQLKQQLQYSNIESIN